MTEARPKGRKIVYKGLDPFMRPRDEWLRNQADDDVLVYLRRSYAACVTHLDRNLGSVLAKADEHGLRDNAVVVFTSRRNGAGTFDETGPTPDGAARRRRVRRRSDHGFSLGEHSLFGKGGLYELQTRVPLLISAPGLAPRRVAAPVALLDIARPRVPAGDRSTSHPPRSTRRSESGGGAPLRRRTSRVVAAVRRTSRVVAASPDES